VKKPIGFTLIEIVVTIVLIGILASVAIVQYTVVIEKSRGTEAKDVLLRAYAGYQRLMFDAETISGSKPLSWTRMSMSDPNADTRRFFNYAPVPASWVSMSAIKAERIGYPSRWLQVDLSSGVITKTSDY
jgi:prepilin-type N-terminal cleavage/methylation domain-containing protein